MSIACLNRLAKKSAPPYRQSAQPLKPRQANKGNNILDSVTASGFHLAPCEHRWAGGLKMRIGDDVRKLVAFLGFRAADDAGTLVPRYGGTGFLVAHPVTPDLPGIRITYLVTARHVAEALSSPFVIGINNVNGKLHLIDVDHADWIYHDDPSVDVSVVNIVLPHEPWAVFPSEHFAEENRLFTRFGVGDLVYIVGLYRLFPGQTRISPVVHTGHVAMAPDDEIPMLNRTTQKIVGTRGYLIEAQTLEGLSGSPVFVRYTNVTEMSTGTGRVAAYSHDVFLLGIWQGAWDGIAGEVMTEQLRRSNARIPVGMGVVIPARRIMEILNSPALEQERAEWLRQQREANAAIMD
jgi:hypothetical protein